MEYSNEGLEALIFTAEGDMRQAINNLQSTFSGFGFVSGDNVFKVCDQPHPITVQAMIRACLKGDIEGAMDKLDELWDQGYSAVDIVVTIFRVVKTFDEYVYMKTTQPPTNHIFYRIPEYTKLEYIKVGFQKQGPVHNLIDIAGNRLDAHAYIGGCGHTHPAWWPHGASVQNVRANLLIAHTYRTPLTYFSQEPQARTLPCITESFLLCSPSLSSALYPPPVS